MMIGSVLVLGAGSAGLFAAITLKRKIASLTVRIVRSSDIGVIGVGEGTTPTVPAHLFEYLKISRRFFYHHAQPTWKIGIRHIWGPRPYFDYPLIKELDENLPNLPMANGYYCQEDCSSIGQLSALMDQGKAFRRQPSGIPEIHDGFGFHIENKKLVDTLEMIAQGIGVEFIDAKVAGAERGPNGIAALMLEDGRRLEADFFIDASGFRSELLGRVLEEPYISFNRSLFCDRAIVGGWERTTEPILPYTISEAMDAGWAWQIEHEHYINRGYVFSSAAISDDDAKIEFLRKNPKIPESARVVKFRAGRYQRSWVGNVVAIGNSCGFVEPLEAAALMVVCAQSKTLCNFFIESGLEPTPTMASLFNTAFSHTWDELRDFLALHYKLNTRLNTPFWQHCRNDTDVSGIAEMLDFYRENGPSRLCKHFLKFTQSQFGADGFLTMLVGNRAPYSRRYEPTPAEKITWEGHRSVFRNHAQNGMTVAETLAIIRHPNWQWYGD